MCFPISQQQAHADTHDESAQPAANDNPRLVFHVAQQWQANARTVAAQSVVFYLVGRGHTAAYPLMVRLQDGTMHPIIVTRDTIAGQLLGALAGKIGDNLQLWNVWFDGAIIPQQDKLADWRVGAGRAVFIVSDHRAAAEERIDSNDPRPHVEEEAGRSCHTDYASTETAENDKTLDTDTCDEDVDPGALWGQDLPNPWHARKPKKRFKRSARPFFVHHK